IARAGILQNRGHYDTAEGELRGWLADAALEPSARVAVLLQLGELLTARGDYEAAGRELGEAFSLARAIGDDQRALRTGVRLVYLYVSQLERVDEAERWWRQTEALLPGFALRVAWQANVAAVHGTLLHHQGRYREAEEEFARTIEMLEQAHDDGLEFG